MAGGAAEVLLISRSCPLPLLRSHSPLLLFFCFLVFAEMGATSTASGQLEVILFLFEKQGRKSHFGTILVSAVSGIGRFCIASRLLLSISMQTKQDPREPVLLMALKIVLHTKLCLSVIVFLICVCWHPERMWRALSS
jgi:hypothetical protein